VVGLTESFKPIADRRGLYAPNHAALSLAKGLAPRMAVAAAR
jgi:chemotaxis protein methyltransferase CheR